MYRKYDEMPVLAKAGAIIPTCEIKDNSVDNPKEIILNVFPGASNEFTLYEDDGKSQNYQKGQFVKTKILFDWDNKTLKISKPEGDLTLIPKDRSYKIILNCVNNVKASSNVNIQKSYKNGAIEIKVKADDEIIISFAKTLKVSENDYVSKVYDILNETCKVPNAINEYIKSTFVINDDKHPNLLAGYIASLTAFCVLTGKSAIGQTSDYFYDKDLKDIFDIPTYIDAYYDDIYTTNFHKVFESKSDMLGLQMLIDKYISEKKF